jgi:hypothetical protein
MPGANLKVVVPHRGGHNSGAKARRENDFYFVIAGLDPAVHVFLSF